MLIFLVLVLVLVFDLVLVLVLDLVLVLVLVLVLILPLTLTITKPLESRQFSLDSTRLASETNQAVMEGVMVTKKAARSVAALQHSLSVEKERVSELAKQADETQMQKIVLIKNQKKGT